MKVSKAVNIVAWVAFALNGPVLERQILLAISAGVKNSRFEVAFSLT